MNCIQRTTTLTILILATAISLAPAVVLAQDNSSPSATLTEGDIQVNVSETTTVTNTYEFRVDSASGNSQQISEVKGSIWKFSDRDINQITASVNGNSVSPEVTEHSRHYNISLPVQNVPTEGTVSVNVSYTVSGPTGEIQAPVFVPDYSTEGTAPIINIAVTLPRGANVQGTMFPPSDTTSGNQLSAETLHVPGMIELSYGSDGGGVDLNTILSAVGVLFILVVIGGWALIQRRRAAGTGGGRVVD